jgi:hypothetical protein
VLQLQLGEVHGEQAQGAGVGFVSFMPCRRASRPGITGNRVGAATRATAQRAGVRILAHGDADDPYAAHPMRRTGVAR